MHRPTVEDWQSDFDHRDPVWINDPAPIWHDLRGTCPIAHTSRYGGVYLPTRYKDICAIANDPENFSSRSVVVREFQSPPFSNAPINSDPPRHTEERRILLRAFGIDVVRNFEPTTRKICRELIAPLATRASCDAAVEYAQHIPARIIALLLGLPESDGELFRKWIYQSLDAGVVDPEATSSSLQEMTTDMEKLISDRRQSPRNDITTELLQATIDGKPLADECVVGMLRLILIAGIDTTWSMIASGIWHLAQRADQQNDLVNQPELMRGAVEELLRAFSPVTMAREIVRDTEFGGVLFKNGEMVLLSFAAANRDIEIFDRPNVIELGRTNNPHVAFGYGRHRCIGAGLARMEIRVALEEWLNAFPSFSLDTRRSINWSEGVVRGPRTVPVLLSSSIEEV